ncbi:conserved hypothetical protein, partial [Enterococcus faecium 1,231,408]
MFFLLYILWYYHFISYYKTIVRKDVIMQVYGIDAVLRIVSHLAFIYLAFWSLRSLRIETFFRPMHNTQIRMAIVLFSIF